MLLLMLVRSFEIEIWLRDLVVVAWCWLMMARWLIAISSCLVVVLEFFQFIYLTTVYQTLLVFFRVFRFPPVATLDHDPNWTSRKNNLELIVLYPV